LKEETLAKKISGFVAAMFWTWRYGIIGSASGKIVSLLVSDI
jgi:hypothetical protein